MAEEKRTKDFGDGEDVLPLCNLQIDGYESEDSSLSRGRACTADDVLSFCNLRIDGYESEDSSLRRGRPSNASDQDVFEFFANPGDADVVNGDGDGEELNEYRKRDYFCVRTASFRRIDKDHQLDEEREYISPSINRSNSVRSSGSDLNRSARRSPVQKVNITALTSMSEKSRRRMYMFGPVKFKPEMDVNALRRRQGRRPSAKIPSIPEGNEIVSVGTSGQKGKNDAVSSHELPRPLWHRSHLAAALARSVGCGSVV
ncbi:hypothetical protein NMG60_11020462 [Bertholletia excelsa]